MLPQDGGWSSLSVSAGYDNPVDQLRGAWLSLRSWLNRWRLRRCATPRLSTSCTNQRVDRGSLDPAVETFLGSVRLQPARISEAADGLGALRVAGVPQPLDGLDAISAGLAGPAYPGRWERTLPLMLPQPGRPAPVRPLVARRAGRLPAFLRGGRAAA
jgi:hypothetical protein